MTRIKPGPNGLLTQRRYSCAMDDKRHSGSNISSTRGDGNARHWIWTAVPTFIAAAVIFAGGCGGGGASGKVGATAGGGGTNGATSGTGGTGGTVSDSVKAATLTSLKNEIIKLGTQAAITASLPGYASSLPGVASATAAPDGNVSIIFKDGVWATVINNRAPLAPLHELPYPPPGSLNAVKRSGIPSESSTAVITYFGVVSVLTHLTEMFFSKNFDGALVTDASIELLSSLSGNSITFIDTHGGLCGTFNPTNPSKIIFKFGLMTNNLAPYAWNSAQKEFEPIAQDLRDPSVDAAISSGTIGMVSDPATHDWMLAVTPDYLKGKWSFPPNSILFNSVCESYASVHNGVNTPYIQMCTGAGLGEFVGYDNEVAGPDAMSDALQLFEGLLGTSVYKPSVRGRAWNVADFTAAMSNAGISTHEDDTVHMIATTLNPFTCLAPGIQYAYAIDAQKQLVLVGDFGSTPGTVTMNGQQLTPVGAWSSTQLKYTLAVDQSSPTFSGPIYVTVNQHDSNWVVLQKIEAKGTYELQASESYLSGTLTQAINWDLFYHVSLQQYRTDPFGALITPPGNPNGGLGTASVNSSNASYQNGGVLTLGGQTAEKWTGSGPLLNLPYNAGATANYTSSIMFPSRSTANLILAVNMPANQGSTAPQTINSNLYDNTSNNSFKTTMDENFNHQAINTP